MGDWRSAIALGLVVGAAFGIGVIAGNEWNSREADRLATRAALALDSATHAHRDTLRALRRTAARVDTVVIRQAARVRTLRDTIRLTRVDTVPVVAALAAASDSLATACDALATTCREYRAWADSLIAAQRAAFDSLVAARAMPTKPPSSRWRTLRDRAAWLGAGALLGVVAR